MLTPDEIERELAELRALHVDAIEASKKLFGRTMQIRRRTRAQMVEALEDYEAIERQRMEKTMREFEMLLRTNGAIDEVTVQ